MEARRCLAFRYSRRRASSGSTPDARLAGSQLANAATAVSSTGMPADSSMSCSGHILAPAARASGATSTLAASLPIA